jgi:tRNA U34 5-carboxymethylaminomethyl modifying GTPase MnmE/TrmE
MTGNSGTIGGSPNYGSGSVMNSWLLDINQIVSGDSGTITVNVYFYIDN